MFISGNTVAAGRQQYDIKSRQWFGSIVKSSGEDGTVLVSCSRNLTIYLKYRMFQKSETSKINILFEILYSKQDTGSNAMLHQH